MANISVPENVYTRFLEREKILNFIIEISKNKKIETFEDYLLCMDEMIRKEFPGIPHIAFNKNLYKLLEEEEVTGIDVKVLASEMKNISYKILPKGNNQFLTVKELKHGYLAMLVRDYRYLDTLIPVLFAQISHVDYLFFSLISEEQLIKSLSSALESRDSYTRGHSERVARYSCAIATQYHDMFYKDNESSFSEEWRGLLKEEFSRRVKISALLHDIGKIGMTDALKKQGSLDDTEFHHMKTHVREGADIVSNIESMKNQGIDCIVRQHHEKFNGIGGYIGYKEEAIHIGARIIAMADSYDAMTSDRVYRKSLPWYYALDDLRISSVFKRDYDPQVFWAFEKAIADDPGSFDIDVTNEDRKNEDYQSLCRFINQLDQVYTKKGDCYECAYKQRYRFRCFSESDYSVLVCSEHYIKRILDSKETTFSKTEPISVAVIKQITDSSLLKTLKDLLSDERTDRKFIGYYHSGHIIIMPGREDRDLYNLLNHAKSKYRGDEKLTAKIIEFRNDKPAPLTSWNKFYPLEEYEKYLSQAKENLKEGCILYCGDYNCYEKC